MPEEKEPVYRARPLKNAGSKAIEDAISKALSELTGYEYQADVLKIDFEPSNGSFLSDAIKVEFKAAVKKSDVKSEDR